MARRKRTDTKDIQSAKFRLAGMKSIDRALDLGEGVSVTTLETAINEEIALIEDYNSTLSSLDQKNNIIAAKNNALKVLTERARTGTGFRFGLDSNEYEMVGGTRKSERKKPTKKSPPTP